MDHSIVTQENKEGSCRETEETQEGKIQPE